MKKLLIAFVCIAGFSFSSQAQDIAPNALGLRLGDSDGFGAEISYQRALGSNNRLELDLGIRDGNNYDGFKLAGLYQWAWNIGGLASYDYDRNDYDDDTFVFAAGDIGIEYDFDIPLVLSLDFRPEIGFGDGNNYYDNDDLDFDIALGIRYQF